MKKKSYLICTTVAVAVLVISFSVILPMGAHIDRLIDENKQMRMEVNHSETIIDSLELMCRLQTAENDLQQIEYEDLEARAAEFGKSARETVATLLNTIDRLREVAGECYRLPGTPPNQEPILPGIKEEADKELENGRHHQTCPRPRVAYPKRTRCFSKDQRVGC